MEYQPLTLKHETTLPDPYFTAGGSFLFLPSHDQVMSFLLQKAKDYVAWKDGGEAAETRVIYPTGYKFDGTDTEGHVVTVRDDGHGYTVCLNTLDKGWTYDTMYSKPVCHFLYIANSRQVTIPKPNSVEKNKLMGNYDTLIEELKNFDFNQLKNIREESENYDSTSTYYGSDDSDYWNFSSSEFNDLEMARIPTPPPPPPQFEFNDLEMARIPTPPPLPPQFDFNDFE